MIKIDITAIDGCTKSFRQFHCVWVESRLRSRSGKQRSWAKRELKRMTLRDLKP